MTKHQQNESYDKAGTGRVTIDDFNITMEMILH